MSTPERVFMLLSIVGRNKGNKLITTLDKADIKMHLQTVGFGTAPSEMMDILGLSSNDKDIVLSYSAETNVKKLMSGFGDTFSSHYEYGGLLMILKPSAINRLTAEILSRHKNEEQELKESVKMSSNHKNSLLIITVAQGFTDEVMHTAKKAGAMGGTVIKGRLAETERLKEVANIDIEEEREIILIMAPFDTATQIMEDVNKKFGLRTEARGIMSIIPVEKAYKI